jgi:hypothetical protein
MSKSSYNRPYLERKNKIKYYDIEPYGNNYNFVKELQPVKIKMNFNQYYLDYNIKKLLKIQEDNTFLIIKENPNTDVREAILLYNECLKKLIDLLILEYIK